MSILAVDDVQMNLDIMRLMFARSGVSNFVTVDSGEEALDKLSRRSFDIMLTDMWMPGMNGAELAAEVRRHSEYDDMLIFAVTADAASEDEAGSGVFDGFIMKPVSLNKVKELIESLQ